MNNFDIILYNKLFYRVLNQDSTIRIEKMFCECEGQTMFTTFVVAESESTPIRQDSTYT